MNTQVRQDEDEEVQGAAKGVAQAWPGYARHQEDGNQHAPPSYFAGHLRLGSAHTGIH